MKITKPFFMYSKDFSVQSMSKMMLQTGVGIKDQGSVASFVCPTETIINGTSISMGSALNICYLVPNVTAKEMAYFQILFNNYISSAINTVILDANIKPESALFSRNGDLCGISMLLIKNNWGIGWHSVFMSEIPNVQDVKFEKITIPVKTDEEQAAPEDVLHDQIQNSFDILRQHGTITSLNMTISQ